MSGSESDRFRTSSNEFAPGSSFMPMSQTAESEGYHLNSRQEELELFLHELRDNQFETITYEMLQELESNFESFAQQHGIQGELNNIRNNQNYENVFNQYFEAAMGPMIGGIQAELDSFSNYIQHNVAVGAEYDSIRRVVDSYQPSSERFRGLGPFPEAFFKRLKRAVSGAWKVASKVAGSAVNVAGRVLKAVALPEDLP